MFYVHGDVGHGGSIDVIKPPHQRSIKPLAVLKQLTYMAAYYVYVVRRRGRLAPRQPLSVCALLPAYEGNRHLRPLGNLGHRLRWPRWIDQLLGRL